MLSQTYGSSHLIQNYSFDCLIVFQMFILLYRSKNTRHVIEIILQVLKYACHQ